MKGFKNASGKSFKNLEAAQAYLETGTKRYYAVRIGHHPGIYHTAEEFSAQMEGFKNAYGKSFKNLADAQAYLETGKKKKKTKKEVVKEKTTKKQAVKPEEDKKKETKSKAAKPSKKYYVVVVGKTPGIYRSLDEFKENTANYPKSKGKAFLSKEAAEKYFSEQTGAKKKKNKSNKKNNNRPTLAVNVEEISDESLKKMAKDNTRISVFVDGSYKKSTEKLGYAMVAAGFNGVVEQYEHSNQPEFIEIGSLGAEMLAVMYAMQYCKSKDIKKMDLYFDCESIEYFANTKDVKIKNNGASVFREYYQLISENMEIRWFKIPGHKNVGYNNRADQLARKAIGLD